ncbi:hypothetical protein [Streptomyces sp. NPDC059991]|uniref:hypothetical protein n=1 Tax=unclassified Streptomyces TaxID=2593676 RepID=UPI00367A65AE
MSSAHRVVSPQVLPDWLGEGAVVVNAGGHRRRGTVQFIGAGEDATGSVTPGAVFLRPEGGGTEWIVADHRTLAQG